MSHLDDHQDEMLEDPLDDLDGLPWLVSFAQDVRFASRGPVPVPTHELTTLMKGGVLRSGFSIDKGDLPVTAASNVHGPAPQAAGLPKWRKETSMPLAFLSTLFGKIAGAGSMAKAAVATGTAFATMTVAGAAAGVLPGPAQGAVGGVINAISPLNVPTGDPTKTVQTAIDIVNNGLASVPTPGLSTAGPVVPPSIPLAAGAGGQTSAGNATAGASTNVGGPGLPQVPVPNVPLPPLPDVTPIIDNPPVQLPACVKNLIPAPGVMPDPGALLAQIPACIQTVLATVNLPVNVADCVASVLGMVTGVLNPSTIGGLSGLDVSACVPLDITQCTSNILSAAGVADMPFVGDLLRAIFGSFGAGGQVGGGGFNFWTAFDWANFDWASLPGLNTIPAGCVPVDISKCLTSLTGGLASIPTTGGVPRVDLSACMPTGLTSGIPGVGSGIPGLSGIPFFPFG